MKQPSSVVIVGNGVAGISVAKELRARQADPSALAITVIARESYDYYSRIRLPEVFGGGSPSPDAEQLALYKPSWYAERHIDVRLGRDAVAIDRNDHTLVMSSGPDIGFDVLVLALGSDPVRPDLPGACLPGVMTVREFDDAAHVRRLVDCRPESAAVVGGGLLGLETAHHLADRGIKRLSVLESAPRLLPRQLDANGAALLARSFETMGMRILTGVKVSAFRGKDRVESIELADGRAIDADTVILSMGVRPRTGLAKAAGLATARGVIVDRFLRTSDPSIYAVGDCAEFGNVSWGIIPAALEQAPHCAAAILGDESFPYEGTVPSNTLKVAGIDVFSAGIVEPAAPSSLREIRFEPSPGRYERYLLDGEILVGAIVIGSKSKARMILRQIGKRISADILGQEITS